MVRAFAHPTSGHRRSQPEYEQHGRVRQCFHLGRACEFGAADDADAGCDGDVLLAVDHVGHRRGDEARADVDLPELLEALVVVSDDGAVEQCGHHDAAAGGEHAAVVAVGQLLARLEHAARRIEHRERAGDAVLVDIVPAAELAFHVRGGVRHDVGAAFVAGDVEQPGPLAERRRPEIGAAMHVGAGVLHHVAATVPRQRVILDVLARIIVDRLAGLGIDALGPGDLGGILHGLEELAVLPVERVMESVAIGVDEELAILAVHLAVDDDLRAAGIVVAVVVGGVLEVPRHLSGGGVVGDGAVGEEIVAGAVGRIVARRRIARAPIGQVGGGIKGARDVEGAAAGLPGIGLVLPGFAAGLAGCGDREALPFQVAGLRVERGHPAAHAVVAAGAADDHGILQRERRRGDLHALLVEQVLVPDDLSSLLVGRDHAPVETGDRDHQVVPKRDAAVAVGLLLAGIHLPEHAALRARAHVDLVDHAPDIGDVHEAVVDQGRRLDVLVGGGAAERDREGELEVLDVRFVDGVERRVALRAEVAMVHEPVLRLGVEQTLEGDVAGVGAWDSGAGQCCNQGRRTNETDVRAPDTRPEPGSSAHGTPLARCCRHCPVPPFILLWQ